MEQQFARLCWIISTIWCLTYGEIKTRQSIIRELLDPSHYDANSIPGLDKDFPTDVWVQVAITDVHTFSETSMEYSMDLRLRQWWHDYRLEFKDINATIESLELDQKQINDLWKPDTFFTNEKRAAKHQVTTTNELIHILNDGTVVSSMRLAMTFKCEMNLQMYPFDLQRCSFELQSFSHSKDHINMNWILKNPILIEQLELPQFQMSTTVDVYDFEVNYAETGTFSTLKADIFFNRKSGFFFLQVFLPSILLVSLSWVSFWVDPNAVPARVSLGVTCVLTMTTQSSGTRMTLPPVSYVKAIDVWMSVCLLFVFAALLEFAYVNVIIRGQKKKPENENPREVERQQPDGLTMARKVDIISRFAFPGVFIVFLVVFSLVCVYGATSDDMVDPKLGWRHTAAGLYQTDTSATPSTAT